MNLTRILTSLRARSGTLFKVGVGLLVLLVVLDALPFVVDKSKAHTAAERLPGFWAIFGFVGTLCLVFLAKTLGALGLQQPEEDSHD